MENRTQPSRRVLLVAPSPPPYGGMALQARLLEKLLREDGVPVVFFQSNLPLPGWLDRLAGVRTLVRAALIWIRLWSRVGQSDIVHVLAASWLYFFTVVCPAVLLGRIRSKIVVLNYRGGEAGRFFRWFGWAVKPIFELAGVITTPSGFLAEIIRNRFGLPVRIVPNVVDHSAFPYRRRTVFQPRMLVTRHLEPIYGVESVLKAFREVQGHYPEASLWIAGTGRQDAYLRRLVSEWRLQNVRFLGHVGHGDLLAVYDQCDILLNGSVVDNYPGALLEASAAGLVVVSTGAGGIPFMYQDGRNALLVEPGDWRGLAAAVEKVLQSPVLAASLTTAALALAHSCEWAQVRTSLYVPYGFFAGENPADVVRIGEMAR